MKLLILGNHTCGNRGDSAILRGLLDAIHTLQPETEVDVMSRYPVSSSWLLNRPVMGDPLYSQMKQHNNAAGVMGRVKKVLRRPVTKEGEVRTRNFFRDPIQFLMDDQLNIPGEEDDEDMEDFSVDDLGDMDLDDPLE